VQGSINVIALFELIMMALLYFVNLLPPPTVQSQKERCLSHLAQIVDPGINGHFEFRYVIIFRTCALDLNAKIIYFQARNHINLMESRN